MINEVKVQGRLYDAPKFSHTKNNKRIAKVSVGWTKSWEKNGEQKAFTNWFSVTAWGRTADAMQGLGKGDEVLVIGELSVNKYTDQEGNKKMSYSITANKVLNIVPDQQPEYQGGWHQTKNAEPPVVGRAQPSAQASFTEPSFTEEDVPF